MPTYAPVEELEDTTSTTGSGGWVPLDTFATRLAMVRQVMGWNMKEAAAECGLPMQSWRNWERGKSPQRIETVARKIASRTGVSLEWLLVGGAARALPIRWFPGWPGERANRVALEVLEGHAHAARGVSDDQLRLPFLALARVAEVA